MALSHSIHFTQEGPADQIYNSCEFYKVGLCKRRTGFTLSGFCLCCVAANIF
jgi:hypothetical protein